MILKEQERLTFFKGGGEMGELIRTKDWSTISIGTPDKWPQSLRTTINIILNSQFPMFVWWGEELITFYNDAYRSIAGEKHPQLLGSSGSKMWAEIWSDLSPLVKSVFSGTSTWSEDQVLYMNRHGYTEETYFTFSYSPVLDESGAVGGLFCACIETTDKVLATRKIEESERNLRNTILQAPVAMCIFRGPNYIIDIANRHMYELWGRGAEELLGKSIFEGMPEVKDQGYEELLNGVFNTGERFIANGIPVTLPRSSGIETIFINLLYEAYREGDGTISGIIAVAIDVTEQVVARKKMEQSEQELHQKVKERTAELESQKNLLDNIMQNSSNGISVTEMIRNEHGKIIDANTILANDAAVRYIGLPREVYLSKTAVELDPNILNSEYGKTCLKTLETGEPAIIQYYMEITGRWLELTLSKMDEDHLIHIFTDVTSIKESQIQLERTIEELRRSNTNLEEFAHAASHDMKEPIRKVLTFSDRLKRSLDTRLTETERMLFDRMETSTQRMGLLVDDLLEFSHVSERPMEMETVDLNVKLQKVLIDLELLIEEKGAIIKSGPLPVVQGYKRQLQQLLQNLVGNALKYTKPGVVPQISVRASKVKGSDIIEWILPEEELQSFHLIEVTDNGIGFEQQYAERIFGMFQRLHGKAEYAGTGVGLSIARKVVENHHGYIWAEGRPGEGATFKFVLPLA